MKFKDCIDVLEKDASNVNSRNIKFNINGKDYTYKIEDVGIVVDSKLTVDKIIDYQNGLSKSKKLFLFNNRKKIVHNFYYKIDKSKLKIFLDELKKVSDVSVVDGHFDASDGVKYVTGTNGFDLNIDNAYKDVFEYFSNGSDLKNSIILKGEVVEAKNNEGHMSVDTMVSSFMTKYNDWEGTRPINLRTALNLINGAVIEPGEEFSYYKYAGPYDRDGYVFYYKYVGNGTCQIATTVYDAALLGGLEITKRYPHSKKSVYVDGGLDATVASYDNGWYVDFAFRNTYKYPIYLKAYDYNGEAHVELWSNSNAKEGKTYSTESVWLGGRGYRTYLHTYKDGVEIDKSLIATTWYSED